MALKNTFHLLSNCDNLMNYPQATIDAFKLDDDDKDIAVSSLKLFLRRVKTHFAYDVIESKMKNHFKDIDFIYSIKYPLPISYNSITNKEIINIALLHKKDIGNVEARDIYSLLVASHIFLYFQNRKLSRDIMVPMVDYMFFLMMKAYGKKYGLVGSFEGEIIKLRFLVSLYIMINFFDMKNEEARVAASNISRYNYKSIKIDLDEYDLLNVNQWIKLLSDSHVLKGISLYFFVSTMINRVLTHNLCLFEDPFRFLSIMSACSINGAELFPMNLQFYHQTSYEKISSYIENTLKK